MNCAKAREYFSAILDNELGLEGCPSAIEHVARCKTCQSEFEQLQSVKEVTRSMRIEEPTEREWESLWPAIYARLTRGAGWALFVVSVSILALYGLYQFLTEPGLEAGLKVLIMGVLLGLLSVFISVAIERYHESKGDKYKEIRK